MGRGALTLSFRKFLIFLRLPLSLCIRFRMFAHGVAVPPGGQLQENVTYCKLYLSQSLELLWGLFALRNPQKVQITQF